SMKEELALAHRGHFTMRRRSGVRRDVHPQEIHAVVPDDRVRLPDLTASLAQGLHFGPLQDDPRLESFLDRIGMPSTLVLGDRLRLVLFGCHSCFASSCATSFFGAMSR